jgi:molybdopterin-biosynthesis enzyme MoeA-like protein
MPRNAVGYPWRLNQEYRKDRKYMASDPVDDGILSLRPRARPERGTPRAKARIGKRRLEADGLTPYPAIMSEKIWTAGLLVIGDEILSGRTHDKNIAQVASWLQVQGIRLTEVRVIADVRDAIVAAVNALRAANDYLFTTGGIGPTHDDITVDAVAQALGVPVVIHPEARAILERYYADKGGLNEGRLRMARVPQGGELIPNRMSGAPGIKLGNIHLMAGVPHITAGMLDALTGQLEGGAPLISQTIGCWVPESEIAVLLRDVEKAHPECQIGSYPFFREGTVGANFVIRSTNADALAAAARALGDALQETGREITPGGI